MVKKLNIPNVYINILREVHCMNAYLVRVNAKCLLILHSSKLSKTILFLHAKYRFMMYLLVYEFQDYYTYNLPFGRMSTLRLIY